MTANPDFVLSETGSFPEVNAGSSETNGIISVAALDGFAGTVTLSCPGTYGAGSCGISPTSVNSFPANATLTIKGSAFAAGAYTLTISGTSGTTTHTLPVAFNVGDYTISGTQTVSSTSGTRVTPALQLSSVYSYSGKINASCDIGSLPGGKCSLTPPNPISIAAGGNATLTAMIDIPTDAATGSYEIKVNTQDITGAPSHNASINLTVAQDFLVTSSTSSQTVTAGQTSGPYALRVRPVGASFGGSVTLACTAGLPAGAQCIFNNPSTPVTWGISGGCGHEHLYAGTTQHSDAVGGRRDASSFAAGAGSTGDDRKHWRLRQKVQTHSLPDLICSHFIWNNVAGLVCRREQRRGRWRTTGTSPGTPTNAGQSTTVSLVVN